MARFLSSPGFINQAQIFVAVMDASNFTCPDGEIDRYDLQRRLITLEYVQSTIQNKRGLEARDQNDSDRFRAEMRSILSDARKTHDYLARVSMIALQSSGK